MPEVVKLLFYFPLTVIDVYAQKQFLCLVQDCICVFVEQVREGIRYTYFVSVTVSAMKIHTNLQLILNRSLCCLVSYRYLHSPEPKISEARAIASVLILGEWQVQVSM